MGGGELWALEPKFLGDSAAHLPHRAESESRATAQERSMDGFNKAELVRPISGDVVVSTGTIYQQPDLVKETPA